MNFPVCSQAICAANEKIQAEIRADHARYEHDITARMKHDLLILAERNLERMHVQISTKAHPGVHAKNGPLEAAIKEQSRRTLRYDPKTLESLRTPPPINSISPRVIKTTNWIPDLFVSNRELTRESGNESRIVFFQQQINKKKHSFGGKISSKQTLMKSDDAECADGVRGHQHKVLELNPEKAFSHDVQRFSIRWVMTYHKPKRDWEKRKNVKWLHKNCPVNFV